MADIKKLNDLELHDNYINDIHFDFAEELFVISFYKWNVTTNTSEKMSLYFFDVEKIYLSELENVEEVEIFRFKVEEEEGKYLAEFYCLTGFGKRDFTLSFLFGSYDIMSK